MTTNTIANENLQQNQQIKNNKLNKLAATLNFLVSPGAGEFSIGLKLEGIILIILYLLWSLAATILTIVSIGLLLPVVCIIDVVIRAISAYVVLYK
jgi:TM2 domain-containing membrane protein YozV